MLVSIIVPIYNQERTIRKDLETIHDVMEKTRWDFEIIGVVDGSPDNSFKEAKKTKESKIKVHGYNTNRGKGYAVRYGMARALGDLIAFIDAGMDINPNSISMVLEHMEWYKADIIVGSKRHPASQVHYPITRRILSRCYQLIIWFLFRLNVRDTQAGLKIYRSKVLKKVLPRLLVKQYAFDLEMLVVARHLGFKRIYEAPIKLKYSFKDLTHASTIRSIYKIWIDTMAIFYRLYLLRYYDRKNIK